MSHYETLGVPKDADQAEIKKAYKSKAQAAHPDKGGKIDDFTKLQKAYLTLSDQTKREHYDTCGEDFTVSDLRVEAFNNISGLFALALDAVDPTQVDLKSWMILQTNAQLTKFLQEKKAIENKIKKRETAIKRLKRKTGGGDDMLVVLLQHDIASWHIKLKPFLWQIKVGEEIIRIWNEYDYIVDMTPNSVQFGEGVWMAYESLRRGG